MALTAQDFKINPSGYFEYFGANVMVFSDFYPEGHQGGVTLVLNGNRKAACGDVRFEISQGQWQGLPKMKNRVVDTANNEISVTLSYPDSTKHMAGFNPMLVGRIGPLTLGIALSRKVMTNKYRYPNANIMVG